MFKSVFAKYIAAFMLIILFCFSFIVAIVTSIVINYSVNSQKSNIQNVAQASREFLEVRVTGNEDDALCRLVCDSVDDIDEVFSVLLSTNNDMTLFLTDEKGKIILYTGVDTPLNMTIPQKYTEHIIGGEALSQTSSIEGVFHSSRMFYAVPVNNDAGVACGTVFVCSNSLIMTGLLSDIVKAIVMSILWVMLAALIAVYVITEKIIAPLREISVAARQFASGQFDTRVSARGEDEVAQLAVAFNHMAESLDNYETMRNTFISNVSHDLRTPMTSIAGFVDGIRDGVIPPEKQEYYLEIVSNEVKRLSRLVGTLLELSRIQAGERKFNPAPFDICEMARQILISFEQKIEGKNLIVEFDVDDDNITAIADRDAIYQVLYNLCDNAVKFSREGGEFKISIHRKKNKKLEISVYNEGQGIAAEDLPYVFERFYKSDKSRGLNKTGVGLGLYITKTIIDSHSESINVESEYMKNCRFTFTLTEE